MSSPPTDSPTIDEQARRRFEAAWRAGRPGPIEQFLPGAESPHYLATLEELVCIELELAWKARRPPDGFDGTKAAPADAAPPPLLDAYLARFPVLREPPVLARLVRQEFRVRHLYGDRPAAVEYRARFPEVAPPDPAAETLAGAGTAADTELPEVPGYQVLGVLGRGGMGVVYKALHLSLGRVVALKMILAGPSAAAGERARFRREAEAPARLQHPNVVQVYEVGEVRGRPYIAMEYVAGGALDAKLAAAPQPPRAAAALVETLARAVHAAHLQQVVHRDLKPANVLLTADGAPKIADFGLAKRLDEAGQTRSGDVVGTPSYMAPEQVGAKARQVGPAADVYALGAILYECLTGRPPFKAASALETMLQVAGDDPVPPRQLQPRTPRDVETICLKCLQKDAGKRYPSAQALAEDLRRFQAGEPIAARPTGALGRAAKWMRRRPAAAALLAALLLLAGGVAAGLLVWQQQEQRRQLDDLRRDERVRAVRGAADDDEAAAEKQLRAGRFEDAAVLLLRAQDRPRLEPGLDDVQRRLAARWDDAHRLAEFYRLSDQAERLAFGEADDESIAAGDLAVRRLAGAGGLEGWHARLPAADVLTPEQLDQLRTDANRTLILLAGLLAKQAYLRSQAKDESGKEEYCGRLREALGLVHTESPWHTARLLELWRQYLAGEVPSGVLKLPDPDRAPAADCYFLGITHYWMAGGGGEGRSFLTANPFVWLFAGLDNRTPLATAERFLRASAERDPKHYWTHLWLGRTLQEAKRYDAAAMAFDACVELRPEYGLGHALRGYERVLLAGQAADPELKREFARRGLEDCRRALEWRQDDASLHHPYYQALDALGHGPEALDALARAIELEPPLHTWDGRAVVRNSRLAGGEEHAKLLRWTAEQPDCAGPWAVLAVAELALENDDAALEAAAHVPAAGPWGPRAAAVRGAVALRKNDPERALAEFRAALAKRPGDYLAASGSAWAYESRGQYDPALRAYDALLAHENTLAEWQILEARLGRARALAGLGRPEEVRRALDAAAEINPRVADALAARLRR
jgi:tetratricopeptide (TPR) repeat protein